MLSNSTNTCNNTNEEETTTKLMISRKMQKLFSALKTKASSPRL